MTAPPILHLQMSGPVNRLSMRLTLGEQHCSGILTHEADGTWSLRWATGDEHRGEVAPLARSNARWHTALRIALDTCETRLIRRVAT